MLSFNEIRVFKSMRMQISRLPSSSMSSSSSDAKVQLPTMWDWVIQGLDVHICMPYRLELRAIENAVEDMMRGLKLIAAAKTNLIFPKTENRKPRKPSSSKFGCVRFCIGKITADIEEEPLQGWLDEHYQLMKNEACESAVRLNFLENLLSEAVAGNTDSNEPGAKKIQHNGLEIDLQDSLSVQKLREEIHKSTFQSYHQACQNLVISEGSGACKEGFQAGFKLSTSRTSLLAISATELDVTLTQIESGDAGMIEVAKKLDSVVLDNDIPFSRLYGSNILLHTGTLAVHLRNYTYPLFSAVAGKCEGRLVLAQQATSFQPQMQQHVYIGRWWTVCLLRSATGTTLPMKTYLDLPLHFEKAEVGFGVGFEPSFTDISYAFTVALRRANLSIRNPNSPAQPPRKERSLPWWDEMRNCIRGKISLYFDATLWNILGTTDPYEKTEKLRATSGYMELHQSDGCVSISAKDFKIFLSSLESLINNYNLKPPNRVCGPFLEAPSFSVDVNMDWECDSESPLNHYLYALPVEGKTRDKVYDPFRSTSLSLRFSFSIKPSLPQSDKQSPSSTVTEGTALDAASPTINIGAHDFAWLNKFWNFNYLPPQKLRSFSRWPRFGVPRIPRSGNLSLDKVMTEFMLRIDVTPTCLKNTPLDDDDPANGLTFKMARLKFELGFGRGRQKFTFDCFRDPLDPVYHGVDLHMLKIFIDKESCVQLAMNNSQSASTDKVSNEKCNHKSGCTVKHPDDGFLLSSDYFTVRKQSPKADPTRLVAWQEAGKKNQEMTYVNSKSENGSDSDDHTRSDPSDDEGFNVVVADNCMRVFVYGLKLLWNLENRDAVWSFVGGLTKALEPPKPSPSRQYAQRKLHEENKVIDGAETLQDNGIQPSPSVSQDSNSSAQDIDTSESSAASATKTESSALLATKTESSPASVSKTESSAASASKTESSAASESSVSAAATKTENSTETASKTESSAAVATKPESPSKSAAKKENVNDSEEEEEEEGTRHFMVNVIQPQFNLHSEEFNISTTALLPCLQL